MIPASSLMSSAGVDTCPVTVPSHESLVLPEPFPPKPPTEQAWHGTAELWTILDATGAVWRDLPPSEDGSFGNKTLWFSENFTTAKRADFDGDKDITVTAVRLDGQAPTVVHEGGVPSYNREIKNFLLVGLAVPAAGCWEVTGRYMRAELSYVLQVEG